jgi:hypothetical protein
MQKSGSLPTIVPPPFRLVSETPLSVRIPNEPQTSGHPPGVLLYFPRFSKNVRLDWKPNLPCACLGANEFNFLYSHFRNLVFGCTYSLVTKSS